MDYPWRLVPQPTSRFIDPADAGDTLCRWVAPECKLKDAEGRLSVEAVDERRIFGYSVNKLPPSEPDDIYIVFHDKERFNQKWLPDSAGIVPQPNEFVHEWSRGRFFFSVGGIHAYGSSYPYPVNTTPHNFRFRVRVAHAPLVANFAHFELTIDFLDSAGNVLNETPSDKSRKVIMADVRQKLIKVVRFEP